MNHFKKRFSVLTAIALTVLLAFSACKTIDSNPVPTVTETTTESISLTQMTTTTTVPTVPTTTTTSQNTTTTTESETTTEATTTTASETTTASPETDATTTAVVTTSGKWTETAVNKTMYTTQACYSRAEAIIGATIVNEYAAGTQVSVKAVTNTGYYKIADGSFIHSDYLTENASASVATTRATTSSQTNAPVVTVPSDSGATAFDSSYTSRYYWDQLTRDEQNLYAKIVTAAKNFDTGIIESNLGYNSKMKIYFLVFNMEPQLFWLDTTADSMPMGLGLRYTMNKSSAAVIQREIDQTTTTVMNQANQYSSTWNKLLVFYNYIILNNDSNAVSANTAAACGIENGLRPGSGYIQCNGYAKTMQYLCDKAGIECLTLPGMNARGTTHAWNKVKTGGKWYIIDATWADPATRGGDFISHPFFMIPDSWTTNSHLMPNQKTLSSGDVITYFTPPAATDSSLSYFKVMNREYTGVDAGFEGIKAELKRAIEAGEPVAELRITDKASYQALITGEYNTLAQRYARTLVPGITLKPQKTDRADAQVIQYNIVYP